ncbi:MAG: hypothetical protein IIB87_07645 [Chloroflexi bacterium]|nr:hypothetical protein [Chloroflexota bacterium]
MGPDHSAQREGRDPVAETITIDRRFCGPPKSGNGGYVGGLLAGYVEGTAEVTLRLPPPIDTPLDVVRSGAGAKLMGGGKLVAEAQPIEIEVDAPPAPSWDEAVAAAKRGVTNRANLQYNSCFVCGLDRGPGDGLCIFPGSLDGTKTMAATWEPDTTVSDPDGVVPPEIVWSALDCPSGFPYFEPAGIAILGRFAVKRIETVRRDERYVILGWPTGQDGRKLYSSSALYTESGKLCAVSKATWIQLDETPPGTT